MCYVYRKANFMMKLSPAGVVGKINPKELGYLCPNGIINFQTGESAMKYAKRTIVKELKSTGKELGVITKDSRVLKTIQGDENRVHYVSKRYS